LLRAVSFYVRAADYACEKQEVHTLLITIINNYIVLYLLQKA
jgi:hypothetical protein